MRATVVTGMPCRTVTSSGREPPAAMDPDPAPPLRPFRDGTVTSMSAELLCRSSQSCAASR